MRLHTTHRIPAHTTKPETPLNIPPLADADHVIATLGLSPHPEGGWYRETWAGPLRQGRPEGTCIYFLLKAEERSHWHKVDAAEIWLFHAGRPLDLMISAEAQGPANRHRLGTALSAGERPQAIVPAGHWQAARPAPGAQGAWSLVSCTVTPGFTFEGFVLAAQDFDIPVQ